MSSIQKPESTTTAIEKKEHKQVIVVSDSGPLSHILDTGKFEHLWRVSNLLSKSSMVPTHFQNQPENCFLVVQIAARRAIDPFMLLQRSYVIAGKPAFEAQIAIAFINTSGLYKGGLRYQVEGDSPSKDDYRVRAYATPVDSGDVVYGPWIDWKLVKGEGWDQKGGSKWKTMPAQMFLYRAAVFFGRAMCPEALIGIETRDEVEDYMPEVRTTPHDAIVVQSVVKDVEREANNETVYTPVNPPQVGTVLKRTFNKKGTVAPLTDPEPTPQSHIDPPAMKPGESLL
jgi:hypothetical protein